MDENKEINKNEQNPNSNLKNNKRYKYKNRRKKRKKIAIFLQNSQVMKIGKSLLQNV